ncbi:MAG: hypothetical protein PF517_21600 [Salinivirgaceae bacterium]|jgi:tetratricopeptide (TPR) repeat protein|nr:hypothetical protein [Salinivirgaceae bacterium]
MKKVVLALLIGLTINVFGQEKDANTLKNEGNESYKNKDYAAAFTAYAEALKLLEAEGTIDEALTYNTGYCAYKAKNLKGALPYFQKSIENGYKESKPYQMVAVIQYKTKDIEGMIETCNAGLAKFTDDEKLKGYASKGYLKQGLNFYNEANNFTKEANELISNAKVQFPEDAEAQEAEFEKAKELQNKAKDEFEKSLPLMEKSAEYDAENENALKALQNIYTKLEMADKAIEVEAKIKAL